MDNDLTQGGYPDFLVQASVAYSPESVAAVREAFEAASTLLSGMKRWDGSPLLDHSVHTAQIVIAEIGLDADSAIATLLHDAVRMGMMGPGEVEKRFGPETAAILGGMNLISKVRTKLSDKQADNFRELILSYSTDPRVILIKLADRLEVMRRLDIFPQEKRVRKSWESLNLYAPIAHKLGLYSVKSELEDISLRWLEPDMYEDIRKNLEASSREREKFIARFTAPIEEKLRQTGIKYQIKGRTKSIFSIWSKMKRTGAAFGEIYDIFAIRIIIDCPREDEKRLCWSVYSVVTDFYTPNPERMRDWISIPKSNGYESLHTTVVTKDGNWVEIQIRSERMNDIAERGIAAHWRYKGVHGDGQGNEEWLAQLRDMIEEHGNGRKASKKLTVRQPASEIFVFTPKGDLRKLPNGATVLDFAFDIHTDVGAACTGARIGERNVSLKEPLKNGDIVSILTSKSQKPKRDWLGYVVTGKAKGKIKAYLREEEIKVATLGREELERKIKNWKLNLTVDDAVNALCKHYKVKSGTELYGHIASGKIDIAEVKEILAQFVSGELFEPKIPKKTASKGTETKGSPGDTLIIDDSIKNLEYKLGKCCNPIFGEEIFGFTTVSSGITIHRADCPNAKRLRELYPYRIIETKWRTEAGQSGSFIASIRILAEDRTGMVNNITGVIANDLKLNIRSMGLTPANKGYIGGVVNVEVPNVGAIDAAVFKLLKIKGIEKAYRVIT